MRVTVLGTRGSFPHIGPAMVRYGGNTSCVEVLGEDGTVVVLDAGTGIRNATAATSPGVRRMDILITHFHMDHVQGLGFFGPLFNPEMEVHIWGPPSTTMPLRQRLARYLSPPLFPVCLRDFSCKLELHDAPRGKFQVGGLEVRSDLICHPGPTMGYRITDGRSSVAYLPDHEIGLGASGFPLDPRWTSGFALCEGVDLLLHDTQYRDDEYAARVGWGHSTPRQTGFFAAAAGVKKLLTFHHDPSHDDETIDQMADEAAHYAAGVKVTGAVEGTSYHLAAARP